MYRDASPPRRALKIVDADPFTRRYYEEQGSSLREKIIDPRVDDPGDARLTVAWAAPDETSFDGPGGTLAVADAGGITFDYHEEWLLQGMDNKPNAFFLLPVALHEIGHCLGLTHAPLSEYRDVMNPYYVANKVRLSDNDISRAKKATKPTT